jgi:DNA-binding FadR family transcriptional regulator
MINQRAAYNHLSDLVRYLAEHAKSDGDKIPSLVELSREMGVSVASLREQLEVARTLGFVEVKPRTGIRRLSYDFQPAVRQSLAYALAVDPGTFEAYSDLRNHIESAYWYEAVEGLTEEDYAALRALVAEAKKRLNGIPPQIPHQEHRELHLLIYRRLSNIYVRGLLEAYWEMYEAVGLNVYTDYAYLQQVWQYHERMVDAICVKDFAAGYKALIEHLKLLSHRPQTVRSQNFE